MAKPGEYYQRDRNWQPPGYHEAYKSSVSRAPRQALLSLPQTMSELTGPVFGHSDIDPIDNDLLSNFAKTGGPIGERMILHGRVLDENARPVPNTLVEIWQANAGGRYRHRNDMYLAPIDPNFGGCGRTITDDRGTYAFRTVKPGAVSVFGPSFAQRLITQLYFEGDPLIRQCPIISSLSDPKAVEQLTAVLDLNNSEPMDCLTYKFDIVLRGRRSTVFENRLEGN
jgi:protocatechuate 3,4-dioxygenase, beta subunit